MERYEPPKIDIIEFEPEDIVTSSTCPQHEITTPEINIEF